MTTSIKNNSWTRSLSNYEVLMAKSYQVGFMRIRYLLILNAKSSLDTENVRIALQHLYRKVPTLRLCIRPNNAKDGNLWFRTIEEEKIDFKVVEESEYGDEKKKSLIYEFDVENGPLWSTRMSPCSQPCPIPDVAKEFPYQYNFLFCFHHAITDGTSNVAICNLFLNILNDVIGNNAIDDAIQLGYHASDEDWEKNFLKAEQKMQRDSVEFAEVSEFNRKFKSSPNVLRNLFPFTDSEPTIESIHYEFSDSQAKKMLTLSKSHGVTLNSFFSTVIMASVIEMIKMETSGNELLKEYPICNGQLVNIRRYLETSEQKPLGCFAYPMNMLSIVRSDINTTFWKHAKQFDVEVKKKLEDEVAFLDDVYFKMTDDGTIPDPFTTEDSADMYNFVFATSNMGNLSKTFPATGEHVQATYLNRVTNANKVYTIHELHCFRGRLCYSFDYNPLYLNLGKAKLWADTIHNLIVQMVKE